MNTNERKNQYVSHRLQTTVRGLGTARWRQIKAATGEPGRLA
jgi:hypothetical protein